MAFNLRSGNKSSFKSLGGSPLRADEDKLPTRKVNDAPTEAQIHQFIREKRELHRNNPFMPPSRMDRLIGPAEGPKDDTSWEDEVKSEDYIVNNPKQAEQGWVEDEEGNVRIGDVGKKGGYKPKLNENKLLLLEDQMNERLGKPMQRGADKAAELAGEIREEYTSVPLSFESTEVNLDPLRHTLAAMYTSEKIGLIPTNILGMMHEMTAKNTSKEHKEDLMNNLIGSVVGKVPFMGTNKKEQLIKKLYEKGYLFSGRPDDDDLPPWREN